MKATKATVTTTQQTTTAKATKATVTTTAKATKAPTTTEDCGPDTTTQKVKNYSFLYFYHK